MNDQTNGAPGRGGHPNGDPKQAASETKTPETGRTRAEERIAALDTSGAARTAEI